MNWWKRFRKKDELESQLDRELRFHFDSQVADFIRAGMSEEEARRRARIEFGGIDQVKEDCRDARGTAWIENIVTDLRYSWRALRKSPLFAVVAIATLALGIGATTAIFSILNAVFLRPLQYPQAERLVWATKYFPNWERERMFVPEYAVWRQQSTAFEHLEAYGMAAGVNLQTEHRSAERARAAHVTAGYLAMLGTAPQLGRTFTGEEEQPGHNRVAVLSDALWRGYLSANPRVLGATVSVNGVPHTVIGIMPAGFVDPGQIDARLWLPNAVDAASTVLRRDVKLLGGVVGMLRRGVSVEAARANLEVVARRTAGEYPIPWSRYHKAASVRVVPLQEQLSAGSKRVLYVLMGAVGFVLLIVCANVANMFLSRAVARRKEFALRASLGASRFRLMRLLLAESLLLSSFGRLLGLLLVAAVVPALRFLAPAAITSRIPIDWHVLSFAAICAAATSVVFGIAPALAVSRVDLHTSMKEGGTLAPRRRRWPQLRGVLVVAQVALSLILLIGAGLLIRSFFSLTNVNPGYDPRNVVTADVALAPADLYSPARQVQYFQQALEALRAVPGVEHASLSDQRPLAAFQSIMAIEREKQALVIVPIAVSSDYFRALKIPLVEGRFLDDRDGDGKRRVVMINQQLARILFPNRDPIGRTLDIGNAGEPRPTVIGVVADMRPRSLQDKVWPTLYRPYQDVPSPWMSFIIRTSADPSGALPAIRRAIAGVDASQPVFDVELLEQRLSGSVAPQRQRALLLGLFAAIALAVASIGVYGVMAYSVARRTHEMGVRIALGATSRAILVMVVSQGMRMAVAGIVLGLAGALWLTRMLSSFLFGVKPTDAATFVAVALLLLCSACAATWVPARKAVRADPMVALRNE